MNLVPYKFLSIRVNDDVSGKNTVPYADVVVKTSAGELADVYFTPDGDTAYSSFQLDANGEKLAWMNPGEYKASINGSAYQSFYVDGGESYSTVYELSLASLSSGQRVVTKGCLTAGDGGHGVFVVVAASGTPDGYSRILLANGNHAVLQPVNGCFNIHQLGAVGNGITNDSSSFARAALLGLPVELFSGKIYIVSGVTFNGGDIFCAGTTTVRMAPEAATYIIRNLTDAFHIEGIIFDGGGLGSPCVNILGGGVFAHRCSFTGSYTSSGFGLGFSISNSNLPSSFSECNFYDNQYHGIIVEESPQISFSKCRSDRNGRNGFAINNFDTTLTKKITNVTISDCGASNNSGSGLEVGNPYNDNDYTGDNFGHNNNTCTKVAVSNFTATGNSFYGLVASCIGGNFSNITTNGNNFGGSLINGKDLTFSNLVVCDNIVYGVDIGQAKNVVINGGICSGNATTASGSESGFLVEASEDVTVKGVLIYGNGRIGSSFANMWVNAVGGTGDGRFFPLVAKRIVFECTVDTTDGRRGLVAVDSPFFLVDSNEYRGTDMTLYTRYAMQSGHINNSGAILARASYDLTPAANVLVVPDVSSKVNTNSTSTVNSIRPYSYNYYIGKVSYVTVNSPGSGYLHGSTTVTISGDGTGAAGIPIINAGKLVGIRITNPGVGYTTANIVLGGAGSGAIYTVSVGLTVFNSCNVTLTANQSYSQSVTALPVIYSPLIGSGLPINVPVHGSFTICGRYGSWVLFAANINLYP